MWALSSLGFASPWLLAGLLALPVLWWLLRATPPAPTRRRFPAVTLLLGLRDTETTPDKTPWWLLALRLLAIALLIIGFAGPALSPDGRAAGDRPLRVIVDGTWAGAPDWQRRADKVEELLGAAGRSGRRVSVDVLTRPASGRLPFLTVDAWRARAPDLFPSPWEPSRADMESLARAVAEGEEADAVWLSDGLAREGRRELADSLLGRGSLEVIESPGPVHALGAPEFSGGEIMVRALRGGSRGAEAVRVDVVGLDVSGAERRLTRLALEHEDGSSAARAPLRLPPEVRNRIKRLEIAGVRSSGAVYLADEAFRRRKIAIYTGSHDLGDTESLLSPVFFLEKALAPSSEVILAGLADSLAASPDVLIMADVASLPGPERSLVTGWVERGGLLVRFAGPRLAAHEAAAGAEDPLMPIRLRVGGRSVNGALSWGSPRRLREFPKASPFAGLEPPPDVEVYTQVIAQPGPELQGRTLAALEDGTPLVTGKSLGRGRVALFHVTANAEWSTLPISDLFVKMLGRLSASGGLSARSPESLAGTVWEPVFTLDAFGGERPAPALGGVDGPALAAGIPGPSMPPGLYASGDRRIALNALAPERELAPAQWPAGAVRSDFGAPAETSLKGPLLALGLFLLLADILATLWVGGRLSGPGRAALAPSAALALLFFAGDPAGAQEAGAESSPPAALGTALAYVVTGDPEVDAASEAGMRGLAGILRSRTSIVSLRPSPVDLETDELAFYPFLYWPVLPGAPNVSLEAYSRLNRYMRAGGMIVFDTRDAGLGGGSTPNRRRLAEIGSFLDIPPLERVPEDHVLTRTFYLLQGFPGRHTSRDVWVEAAPAGSASEEGAPFRNLNDGVSPVLVGHNDWAASWAVDERGRPMFMVAGGSSEERQREHSYRFGVNLVMYALTGNYKSDQVHIPALMQRIGN